MSDSSKALSKLCRKMSGTTGTEPGREAARDEVARLARACREELVTRIDAELGPFDPRHLQALVDVPRERFVRPVDLERCADDAPLPLDDVGLATISAPHAYVLSFRLLELAPGDSVVELGSGSGYGAALAAYIVGATGHVLTIEIDEALAHQARRLLEPLPNVDVVHGDALKSTDLWNGAMKLVCTFAVDGLPPAWLSALPPGATLVAPVTVTNYDQQLVRVTHQHGELRATVHGAVRYVKNRSPA